jgi:hypothetical protein
MSKFLLNFLVQISKALTYSKIQFLSEKKSSLTFGPSGQAGRASPPDLLGRAANQAEPAHQAEFPPFSFLPEHAGSAAASSLAAPLPCHGATAMNAPPP